MRTKTIVFLDTVIFDNSSSLLRNKKIHHCIRLIPPTPLDEESLEKS